MYDGRKKAIIFRVFIVPSFMLAALFWIVDSKFRPSKDITIGFNLLLPGLGRTGTWLLATVGCSSIHLLCHVIGSWDPLTSYRTQSGT